MAESVLSSLVKTDKDTKKRLDSIDSTLQKMYALQIKTAKEDKAANKREEQRSKRKGGDSTLSKMLGDPKESAKKEKKGIFDWIKNLFKGLFSGGLGSILGKLGIGAAIASYIASPAFRNLVNKNILQPLGQALMDGLFGTKGLFGSENRQRTWEWMQKNPLKTFGLAAASFAAIIGPKSALMLGFKGLAKGIGLTVKAIGVGGSGLLAKLGSLSMALKGTTGAATATKTALMGIGASFAAKIAALIGSPIALAAGAGMIRDKVQYNRAGGAAGGGDLYEQLMKETVDYKNELTSPGGGRGAAQRLSRSLREDESHANYRGKRALADELIEIAADLDRERKAATTTTASGPRGRNRTTTTDDVAIAEAEAKYRRRLADIERRNAELGVLKRQSGGPIQVPGSGSGDKVPMMLPSGSFVLNRNAAGFQNGGLIPTLLEPGESVYGPGQWGAHHVMMNSAIPRFQSGGAVESSHPDTGSGWSIGKDAQGRPAIFSKGAADALLEAIGASNGIVKTSDITSSTRSPAKNSAVGGVPNSNHLYGNAVDIHGTSKAWLKQNGPQYGWHNLVYSGHDGHFDYKGGGARLVPGDGDETTAATTGVMGGGMQSILNGLGHLGDLVKGMVGAIGEVFGPELNSLFGGLGGLLGSGGVTGGTSNSGGSISGSGLDKAAKVRDSLIADMGISKAAASGIVGNLYQESVGLTPGEREGAPFGVSEKPWPKGTIGKGYGWAQWTNAGAGGRLDRFIDHIGGQDKIATDAQNYSYLLSEMRGREPIDGIPQDDPAKAAVWFRKNWERAGIPHDDVRQNYAKQINMRQSGGAVHLGSTASSSSFARQSEDQFIQRMASAMGGPVVVATGGGANRTRVAANPGTQTAPPTLDANPSNMAALDLAYRLSMGASFA